MKRNREELLVWSIIAVLALVAMLSGCVPGYSSWRFQFEDCEFFNLSGCPASFGVYPSQDLALNQDFRMMYGWQ